MSPTPKRRRGPLAAAIVLAATVAPAVAAGPAVGAAPAPASRCGPMDVVFVVDTTGSMSGAVTGLQAQMSTILDDVDTLSGGDYQTAVVTFKNDVTVNVPLAPGNQAASLAAVSGLGSSGGGDEPEASDEALNTAVNTLPAAGRPQTGDFTGTWRTHATKHVIMITDARPGGFNDAHDGTDVAMVNQVANDALLDGIMISPVYVPTSTYYSSTITPLHAIYANTTTGVAYQSNSTGSNVAMSVRSAVYDCGPTDVYMRDNLGDSGLEPLGAGDAYTSPDVRVCNTSVDCGGWGVDPIAGQTNWIFVDLHNPGPGGSGAARGTLYLYYIGMGGAALWDADWIDIGYEAGIDVPPGVTTVKIPWYDTPGPDHFCLLARWVSASDPMTFAETTATHQNARNNNNIAWRNVNTVPATAGTAPVKRPFTLGNPLPGQFVTDLVVGAGERRFDGRITIDLGRELYARWKSAGGRMEGLRQVGNTAFDVIDNTRAAFRGIPMGARERYRTEITFTGGPHAAPGQVVRVYQTDPRGVNVGGVEYRIAAPQQGGR